MVLLGITAIKSLQHNNRHFMSACWTVLRRYQSCSKEQVTDIDCWMCILHKMLRPSWAEGSLWRWDTAGTWGFWCCIKRRRGMTEPLEKVLITNLKLIDSLNYQNKLIFQYFPVLSHYWRDFFFFLTVEVDIKIFLNVQCVAGPTSPEIMEVGQIKLIYHILPSQIKKQDTLKLQSS